MNSENENQAESLPKLSSIVDTIQIGPGTRIGSYILVRQIGEGGMGAVYLAQHARLKGRKFAIKFIRPELIGPSSRKRFDLEIDALAKIEHENFVFAHDAGEFDGVTYLVMDFVNGISLSDIIRSVGPLAVADAAEIVSQVCDGLEYIHKKNLVHRDIKPSNLHLDVDGNVKILDLGLVRVRDEIQDQGITGSLHLLGTPDYMSPEQCQSSRNVDIRSDIYSLGCTLYHLLCGRAPFSDKEHSSYATKLSAHLSQEPRPIRDVVNRNLPVEFADIVSRMMRKSAEARYQTPAELGVDLKRFTNDADIKRLLNQTDKTEMSLQLTSRFDAPSVDTTSVAPRHDLPTKESFVDRNETGSGSLFWIGSLCAILLAAALLGWTFLNQNSEPLASQNTPQKTSVADAPQDNISSPKTLKMAADGESSMPPFSNQNEEIILSEMPRPAATSLVSNRDGYDALDLKVRNIIRSKCVMCHDNLGEDSAGGDVHYLLQFQELLESYINIESPEESYLLDLVPAEMPKKKMRGEISWGGALTDQELNDFQAWVKRGGPSQEYLESLDAKNNRTIISVSDLTKMIVDDLGTLRSKDLENARYLTLFNLHNNPNVSDEDLGIFRNAVAKILNSLSRQSDILIPKTIDESKTTFRFDIRDLGWTHQQWDLVAQHYPYDVIQRTGLATTLYQATSSDLPYLRADWFVFAATQPPLYHQLVNIPDSLTELENRLFGRPDARLENIRTSNVMRAGFGDSGVSQNNRLIERHNISTGAFWISYDFAANDDKQNLMTHPLGPTGTWQSKELRDHEFEHDGGEVIFNLPNGFQGYGLFDANGIRIDVGPSNIVHDDTMTGGAIINGISCISCHNRGMKPENQKELVKLDRVRRMASENFTRFDETTRIQIEQLYPAGQEFAQRVREDRKRFESAMRASGNETVGVEPVRALFNRFARDLNAHAVAAELGISLQDLETLMNREGSTRQLLVRLNDEGIKRQLFLTSFQMIGRLTGIGSVREPVTLHYPFFGETSGDATPANSSAQSSNQSQRTGIPFFDEDNTGSQFNVRLETVDNKKHFKKGDQVQFIITADQDGFVLLTAIDSEGESTQLIPNQWHSGQLKAGQRTIFPTDNMHEFYVHPPYGRTLLKAKVSKHPVSLKGIDDQTVQNNALVPLGNVKSIKVREIQTATGKQSFGDAMPTNAWGTARLTIITKEK